MNHKLSLKDVTPTQTLPADKFADPDRTVAGEPRAAVDPREMTILWINTGSQCNLACENCYIESSPSNDRLAYISAEEVLSLLCEIEQVGFGTREIGFTGGEPFLNREMLPILELCLERKFKTLVLTNGMNTLLRESDKLESLNDRFPGLLKLRISLDHYTEEQHALERGKRSWKPAIKSLQWLNRSKLQFAVAARATWGENEEQMRSGFNRLFGELKINLDAQDPDQLIIFPEMDESVDVPEITTACWDILDVDPGDMMCASSRMVVKRKGESKLSVQACTLLPYDQRFNLGSTLKSSWRSVKLNHPHCAKFCVLGGGSCSG